MTEPFIGEVQIFGFNYAPYQWALCNGATMAIQQNSALFALIGVNYGGNGTTNFQLPNLTARAPCNQGQGPGLTPRSIGGAFGAVSVGLTEAETPAHNHGMNVFTGGSGTRSGTPVAGAALSNGLQLYAANPTLDTTFAPNMMFPAGNGVPHENRQPFLALNFCIALDGVFPSFP